MFDEISGIIITILGAKPTAKQRVIFFSSIIGVLTLIFALKIASTYLNSPRPTIEVLSPAQGAEVSDSETLLIGKVTPADSKVVVDGKEVSQNGNGTFSRSVELKEGKNTISIDAQYFGKKSSLLYRAVRILSQEEKAKIQKDKDLAEQKIKDAAEKLAKAESLSQVLSAAQEKPQYDQSIILSQKIITKGKEKIVSGIIKNTTEKTIGWVKISSSFQDDAGATVDKKDGYATSADQYLAPGAEMPYALPSTHTDFTTFDLKVTYDSM